ncbi:MAG: cobalamin biosynthesis protein, partial [Acidimicrobiaceae bacterium]|nr:cobalamin biosynthesis protein [Acidimicrobiaceae bacterium]
RKIRRSGPGPRYGNFGWAAARLDDMANYVPARIFAGLVAVLYPDRTREIFTAVRRDAVQNIGVRIV